MEFPEQSEHGLDGFWSEYLDLALNGQNNTTEQRREILKGIMEAGLERGDDADFER